MDVVQKAQVSHKISAAKQKDAIWGLQMLVYKITFLRGLTFSSEMLLN